MSRVQTKQLQRKERNKKVITVIVFMITNFLVLNISLLAVLEFLVLISILKWKSVNNNCLVIFWLLNFLAYPITSGNAFIALLITLASTELLYLASATGMGVEGRKEESTVNNIVDLMNLNSSVVSTVFEKDKRYDFNVHNGKYEEKNTVQISMSGKYITDFVNNNIVKAKQMLGAKELSGECLLHSIDLKDLRPYRRDREINRVCETLEQEQFMFKTYVDNRVELLKEQLQENYSIDNLEEVSVADYTQEIMSNKIKVEQRFKNLQTLVDQLVLRLKTT